MKITYVLEPKDMAAYVGDYLLTTREGKQQVLHKTLAPSVTTSALMVFFGLLERQYSFVLGAALLFPLVFVVVRITVLVCWKRNAAKYSAAHPELLGTRELEIASDVLIQRAEGTESRTAIANVSSIANTNTLILVNLGAAQAIIVPKRNLTETQIAALLKLKENPNMAPHGPGCSPPGVANVGA